MAYKSKPESMVWTVTMAMSVMKLDRKWIIKMDIITVPLRTFKAMFKQAIENSSFSGSHQWINKDCLQTRNVKKQ